MAQTNISVRMDEELKTEFEDFCKSIGLTMSAAICVFAKRVVAEQKIPFELVAPDKKSGLRAEKSRI
ncbi:MAG: type II toxin-antitoxin system RelB/DinJ family antitoxin [Oscillospiraceae bacterium]|nr:type II toxin-antitoxin system RelB/DinJ family antitoxin [Oscillospiraceae bacterium]